MDQDLGSWQALEDEAVTLGKPAWREMLAYVAGLHRRSTHPPRPPFPFAWEEIGPGYCYGPAFGHWDLIHQALDVLPTAPWHARAQLLNNLAAQEANGLVPGVIWMREAEPRWSHEHGHPPVWVTAAQDYHTLTGDNALLATFLAAAQRQISWFETARQAEHGGFYYTDILTRQWESGVDEGVRFDDSPPGRLACIDATSHMYLLYSQVADWCEQLGEGAACWRVQAATLRDFICNQLYDPESGFFYDIWSVRNPARRVAAFEGMWPLVSGAATNEQAQRVIDEHLLNPARFFTAHPIATVGRHEPRFELRMWRGPAWNSMTYWAARGCLRYGRPDAALRLVERALDASAAQFTRTGTVWEFYDPDGGRPEDVRRKPQTPYNAPCRDYLGHNPLLAMARIFAACAGAAGEIG